MNDLNFIPVCKEDLHILSVWFEDPELCHRVQKPTPQFLYFIQNSPEHFAWMIIDNLTPVGYIHVEIQPNLDGYFAFAVDPHLKRQGIGKRILACLPHLLSSFHVHQIIGTVEVDNAASIGCLQSAGFFQSEPEPDEEGFYHFVFRLRDPEKEGNNK